MTIPVLLLLVILIIHWKGLETAERSFATLLFGVQKLISMKQQRVMDFRSIQLHKKNNTGWNWNEEQAMD